MSIDHEREKGDPFGLSRLNDPEVEAVERARLIPVGEPPSPEMQEAFRAYAFHSEDLTLVPCAIRAVPGKLFLAVKRHYTQYLPFESYGFKRTYFREPSQKGFSFYDEAKNLDISINNNQIESATIELEAERTSIGEIEQLSKIPHEEMSIAFYDQIRKEDMSTGFSSLHIDSSVQGERLSLTYNEGELVGVDFTSDSRKFKKEPLTIWKVIDAKGQIRLAEVINAGRVSFDLKDGNYEIEIDDERTIMKITRKLDGKSLDWIEIPLHIHEWDIFIFLFPQDLLVDPYMCSSSYEQIAEGEDLEFD